MEGVSPAVKRFFDEYERNMATNNLASLAAQYGDTFMFAGPQGAQAVKKEDFLRVLPKRDEVFKAIGLQSSQIISLYEAHLDERYIQVKVGWKMRFVKNPDRHIESENRATYILFRQEDTLKIVFQLDHQDLMKRVQELGLLPG